MEQKKFVAIVGCANYFGKEIFQLGQEVMLAKEKENVHDAEAIKAEIPLVGKVGYVANSTHTVPIGCRSAGRIYDTFDERTSGKVRFIVKDVAVVELGEINEEVK